LSFLSKQRPQVTGIDRPMTLQSVDAARIGDAFMSRKMSLMVVDVIGRLDREIRLFSSH
jgi:hypothetical protein